MKRILLMSLVLCLQGTLAYGQDWAGEARGDGPEPEEVDGWDGEAIRVAYDGEAGQQNGVAFDQVVDGEYELLQIDFELRIWNEDGEGDADGLGFAYADSDFHGETIDDGVPNYSGEEPNLAGSIGVGFDTWNNSALDNPDVADATVPNTFSLHYDGIIIESLPTDTMGLTEDWIQDGAVKQASIQIRADGDDAEVTVNVTNTETGQMVTPFDAEPIDGFIMYNGRPVFRARTGGENSNHDIDNISITHTPPGGEPTTYVLYGSAPGGGETPLEAGDANQDLQFNQLDLVMVQIAAKYLTGEAATWGEGDWNAAPGGSVGSPPTGDGVFAQTDIIAALNNGLYLTGPYGALAPGPGNPDDEQTSIVYDPKTGELGVNAPVSTELTSINIDSAAGIFTGDPAENLGGSFDNDADDNIFKATFGSSFGSLSFGNVATPGLSEEVVAGDLTVVGSLAGGGDLGAVDLIYVPEPSAAVLLVLGLVAMLSGRRRR